MTYLITLPRSTSTSEDREGSSAEATVEDGEGGAVEEEMEDMVLADEFTNHHDERDEGD